MNRVCGVLESLPRTFWAVAGSAGLPESNPPRVDLNPALQSRRHGRGLDAIKALLRFCRAPRRRMIENLHMPRLQRPVRPWLNAAMSTGPMNPSCMSWLISSIQHGRAFSGNFSPSSAAAVVTERLGERLLALAFSACLNEMLELRRSVGLSTAERDPWSRPCSRRDA